MAEEKAMLEKEKQEEPLQVQKAETLHEHLNSLMNWDLQEGQTIEERRSLQVQKMTQQQMEDNQILHNGLRKKARPIRVVTGTASGTPVQAQPAKKLSFKERRERKRLEKQAKKLHPEADADSMIALQDLQEREANIRNSATAEQMQKAAEAGVEDPRVLLSFCDGYKKDRKGRPKTPEDAQKKQSDAEFLDDYLSCDLQKRKPHLDKMVDYFINLDTSPEMLDSSYIIHHAADLKVMSSRTTCMENIMNDPVNKPYFQALDPYKYAMLNASLSEHVTRSAILIWELSKKGIQSANTSEMYDKDYSLQSFHTLLEGKGEMLDKAAKEAKKSKMQAADEEADRIIERESVETLQDAKELAETVGAASEIKTTALVTEFTFADISEMRERIEKNPQDYVKNMDVLDKAFQEFYRTRDAMGDPTLVQKSIQRYLDKYMEANDYAMPTEMTEYMLQQRLVARQEVATRELADLLTQGNCIRGVIRHLAGGSSMQKDEELMLERLRKQVAVEKAAEEATEKVAEKTAEKAAAQPPQE